MNYRFHPAAEVEYLEQVAFYESRERGLGARYRPAAYIPDFDDPNKLSERPALVEQLSSLTGVHDRLRE